MTQPFQHYANDRTVSLGGATSVAKLGQNFEILLKFGRTFVALNFDHLTSRCKRFSHNAVVVHLYIIKLCG